MSDTIRMLQIEHRNTARILSVLEDELASHEEGGGWDAAILRSALEYCTGYLDQCHHPIEDAVCRRLQERSPQVMQHAADLDAEHKRLSELTTSLHLLVNARADGSDCDEVAAKLSTFVETYHAHMQLEERHFFPAALRELAPSDWWNLDFDVFDRADPLFDREKEAAFETLRKQIVIQSVERQRERALEHELESIRAIDTVAQLNELWRHSQHRMTLRAAENGRFEIVQAGDGTVLEVIPECTERVAVWCAYFYAKGLSNR